MGGWDGWSREIRVGECKTRTSQPYPRTDGVRCVWGHSELLCALSTAAVMELVLVVTVKGV